MSLMIGDNLVVSINYKLADDDGNVLDSSEGSEPLVYLHGADNIIPGLEKALVGKVEGDSLHVRVEPAEGYGEFIPDLIQTVERSGKEKNRKVMRCFQCAAWNTVRVGFSSGSSKYKGRTSWIFRH